MRRAFSILFFAAAAAGLFAASSHAEGPGGMTMTVTGEGAGAFYLAIGDYYGVPERDVMAVRQRRVPDEEVPVVFFLSQRGGVPYERVLGLRQDGMSWMDITLRLGLGPEIFYVPLGDVKGPPYGRAYGYYRNRPRKEWHAIRLADADVTGFVNLIFISEYHSRPPDEVVRLRGDGMGFVMINERLREAGQKATPGRGKGKGRNR